MPFLVDKTIISDIIKEFPFETNLTSSHHIRSKTDLQYEMLFLYYTTEKTHLRPDGTSIKRYNWEKRDQAKVVGYAGLEDNYRRNAVELQGLRNKQKKFNCINDNMSHKEDITDSHATYR